MMLNLPFYLFLTHATFSAAEEAAKIGPGVCKAMESNGFANVVIALESPSMSARDNLGCIRAVIASTQQGALSSVASSYHSGKVFSYVPALAGAVHTQEVLDKLDGDPLVVKVNLGFGAKLTKSAITHGGERGLLADSKQSNKELFFALVWLGSQVTGDP